MVAGGKMSGIGGGFKIKVVKESLAVVLMDLVFIYTQQIIPLYPLT